MSKNVNRRSTRDSHLV